MNKNYVAQMVVSFISVIGMIIALVKPWFTPYASILFALSMFVISYNYKEYKKDKKAIMFFIFAILFFIYAFLYVLGVL